MYVKLTVTAQLSRLRAGDIIKRFPFNSIDDTPQDTFDESSTAHIMAYEIRSINQRDDIFSLIGSHVRTLAFAAPVDIARLFIRGRDLIAEKVWWISL
jgi:hypothetical protein